MNYAYSEAVGSRFLHSVGTYLPDYMVTLSASNDNPYYHNFKLFLDDRNSLYEPS
jgi:hypothetical protein